VTITHESGDTIQGTNLQIKATANFNNSEETGGDSVSGNPIRNLAICDWR